MSFEQYYQDELAYLREMGEVFADAYPKLAPFLAQKGHDPDVERLLEGFAFIAGRIRQKLDDELPELTHNLHSLLWPHLLRPIPALSILQFTPIANAISEKKTVSKGIEVDSLPVDGTACRFRTCYDVDLYPLSIKEINLDSESASSVLTIKFVLDGGASLDQINLDNLRMFLFGDYQTSFTLYLFLFRYLKKITVQSSKRDKENRFVVNNDMLRPVGFADNEELAPYPQNAFIGYRLIQEYFSLPHKFLFFDLNGMGAVAKFKDKNKFEIQFEFDRRIEKHVRINKKSILLNCTPIINIFEKDADPIRLHHEKVEYHVRPSVQDQSNFEIFKVNNVVGWAYGGRKKVDYFPFVSFDNSIGIEHNDSNFYQLRIRPSVVGKGVDTYMSFTSPGKAGTTPVSSTVTIELTCTNRGLPEKLKIGDISVATGTSPEFAEFKNVLPATPSTPPPLDKDLHWQLISNMSLNYLSLANVEALRVVLSTYNFQAYGNRQAARAHELKMEGIRSIKIEPSTMLFNGMPIRGHKTSMEMKSSNFSGEGEMFVFATILSEFFSLYSSMNSFNQLIVKDVDKGEEYRWPAKIGQQPLL